MKKSSMGIAPDGKPVIVTVINGQEQNTEINTLTDTNTISDKPAGEITPAPEQQDGPAQPARSRQEEDTRTTEQKITDMRKALEEKQKLMERFSDLQTKHDRFTSAREELTPDDCEVVLNVNGRRFSSTDPQAVNRFISFQIDSYSLEIEKVAALLLA